MARATIFRWLWLLLSLSQALPGFAQPSPTAQASFDSGTTLLEQGDHQQARLFFQKTLSALAEHPDKKLQAHVYNKLAICYAHFNIDSCLNNFHHAFSLAIAIQDTQIIISSSSGLCEIYAMRGQRRASLPFRLIQNEYNYLVQDWYTYTNSLTMTGNNYIFLGQLDSAKWYIERSLFLKDSLHIRKNLSLNYNHLATLYQYLNAPEESITYHLRCIEELEKQKDTSQLAIQFLNLSRVFLQQGNLSRAEEYNQKSIAVSKSRKLRYSHAAALAVLANIRERQDNTEEALALYKESLAIAESINLEGGMLLRFVDLGNLYLKQRDFSPAEDYLNRALPVAIRRNIPAEVLNIYFSLTELKILQQKLPQAKAFLDTVRLKVSQTIDQNVHLRYLVLNGQYLEQSGQYEAAFVIAQQTVLLRDSIFNLKKSERIHELEEKYERANKEKEITLLNTEKELKELYLQQNQRNNLMILLGLLLACAALTLLFYFYRLRRRTNERLAEKNALIARSLREKEVLLKEIHHRVKNNLQTVSSLLQLQSQYIEDPKALNALQEGRNRVKSMAMIHQDLYREDNLTGIDIKEYIEKLSESLFQSYNIDTQSISLETRIDPLNLDVDTVIPLGLILNELITNALKYAFPENSQGNICVTLKEENEFLLLEVRDNGVGMKKTTETPKADGGFGFKLINTFASKLKAQFEVREQEGTAARLLIHNYKLAPYV